MPSPGFPVAVTEHRRCHLHKPVCACCKSRHSTNQNHLPLNQSSRSPYAISTNGLSLPACPCCASAAAAVPAPGCSSASACPEARSTARARASAAIASCGRWPWLADPLPPVPAPTSAVPAHAGSRVVTSAASFRYRRHRKSTPQAMAPGAARKAAESRMCGSLLSARGKRRGWRWGRGNNGGSSCCTSSMVELWLPCCRSSIAKFWLQSSMAGTGVQLTCSCAFSPGPTYPGTGLGSGPAAAAHHRSRAGTLQGNG